MSDMAELVDDLAAEHSTLGRQGRDIIFASSALAQAFQSALSMFRLRSRIVYVVEIDWSEEYEE